MIATTASVADVVGAVPDPEMPPVTLADLGMVVDVRVLEGRVEVDLVPTYSGCPATHVIREDVATALRSAIGVEDVTVTFVNTITWTPERITEEGRRKLREFGIAPPGSGQTLPAPGQRSAGTGATLFMVGGVTCPLCGSRNTVADSPFGPTPCRASHYCRDCRNPFEVIKP